MVSSGSCGRYLRGAVASAGSAMAFMTTNDMIVSVIVILSLIGIVFMIRFLQKDAERLQKKLVRGASAENSSDTFADRLSPIAEAAH